MNAAGSHSPPNAGTALAAPRTQRVTFSDIVVSGYLQAALVIAAALGGIYLCIRLAEPFLTPLAVAIILSILFVPAHRWIESRVRPPTIAAAVSVLGIAFVVIVPIAALLMEIIAEAAAGARVVRAEIEGGVVQRMLDSHPSIAPAIQSVTNQVNLQGLAADAASWLTNASATLLRGSIVQFIGVLLTFYLLFYFLRDRRAALVSLRAVLPFTVAETDAIFRRVTDTVHATIYGIIITGAVQGILGGTAFALVGLPAPLLWGLVIALFAIMPVLGTGMIWIPAAIYLGLEGELVQALILSAAFIGITVLDSLLYPALVGDRMKLHTALTFISAIGGLILFGAPGFVLGPMVVAITLAIEEVLRARLRAIDSRIAAESPAAQDDSRAT